MAAFTASVSGNWNDGATWGNSSPGTVGVDFPGASDTATIGAQKIVTIPAGYSASCGEITYGTGISSAHTGLIINGSLTMGGAITMHSTAASYSDLSLGAGATLTMGAYNVVIPDYSTGSNTWISFAGTSGSRCTVSASGGAFVKQNSGGFPYADINIAYTDFSGLGASFNGVYQKSGMNYKVSRCTFNNCNVIYIGPTNGCTDSYIEYSDFTNAAHASNFVVTNHDGNNYPSGRNEIKACTFDNATARYVQINNARRKFIDCITKNVILSYASYGASNTKIVSQNFLYTTLIGNMLEPGSASPQSDIENNYWYNTNSNPHFIAAQGGTMNITYNVFETNSATYVDPGDIVMLYNAASVITCKYNLCIGTSNNSPLLSALGGASCTGTKVFDNNTLISKGDYALSAFSVGETFAGMNALIDSIRNNIVVGHANKAGNIWQKIVRDLSGTVSGIVTNADYNAYQNITTRYSIIGGTYGTNDINANPNFVDDTRNLATWDAENGGPGTAANAITEMFKLNTSGFNSAYSVANLLAWVKAGFVPTNVSLKGAGFDGSDIGAFPVSSFNIKVGTTTVTKIYIGNTQVQKVYLGSTQI